jgi:Spy/CpxP family protein refolding chaperone
MRIRRAAITWAALTLVSASSLAAQRAPRPRQFDKSSAAGQHAQLEQRLRQRLGAVVRKRLQLTDDQFQKLTETNRKYERQRRALVQQETQVRRALRAELSSGDQADQQHVADLMNQLVTVQQQRLALLSQEQQDLSTFLTPVQRAKYVAIEEQIRRRVEQLRQRQLEGGGADTVKGQGLRPPR